MSRSIIIKLDNTGALSDAYYLHGNQTDSLNNYLIRVNRILNEFENVKHKKISYNEIEITDSAVIKKLLNRLPNNSVSKDNAGKKVIASVMVVATMLGASRMIKNTIKNNDKADDLSKKVTTESTINLEDNKIQDSFDNEKKPVTLENGATSYSIGKLETPKQDGTSYFVESTEEEKEPTIIIETPYTFDEDIPVYEFNYEDRSNSEKSNFAKENYNDIVNKYSTMYGLDSKLVLAMLTQENAYNEVNYSNVGANGVMQIESIWYGQNICAYNYESNSYETVTIEKDKLTNPEYSIKIGCMILNNYYTSLYNNYVTTGVISKSDSILATIIAYNKGITAICNLINTYGSDFTSHISETRGGDNDYINHVSSYMEDMSLVELQNKDDSTSQLVFDNLSR